MTSEITTKGIESRILTIRNQQVMIDRDIAELYGVETRRLNEQVKRNSERFPEEFCFQLTKEETESISSKSQIATLNVSGNLRGSNIKKMPFAFTEQGVAMLSTVLKSDTAVSMSIQIMKAFVAMRKFMLINAQVFDAYAKFESFIAQAQKEIILIDNYVDLSILERFSKKKPNVKITIWTSPKTPLTLQDIQQFNTQYPTLTVNHTSKMHDRF